MTPNIPCEAAEEMFAERIKPCIRFRRREVDYWSIQKACPAELLILRPKSIMV